MSALIRPHHGQTPRVATGAFIAETAVLIGEVEIGEDASIWYGTVLRGDGQSITVGARTNIQDGTIVHITSDRFPTVIGSGITIGHGAIIHACTLEDDSFVGMGATVMDGAVVQRHAMVAAGALVTPGKLVPTGELWAGSPAKKMRDLTEADFDQIHRSAEHYCELARSYMVGR
ncbi:MULTISPECIES: gamma carbonic anhydrase family protein [Thalassobaculum]|uniref:Carbonic anhydrase or acetyltransferase, isoleucine patch superfamily n=1 Tax=Thalassobaculum litoreum DSM 18839 TaxID=1123362 RepID=A0A8G2BDW7_9PROT|nr:MULTISPECIES: gamma carbonic anhydrase family protein [Thalassobaculum]SDF08852.1 Carbonic anhydrase or acetyltransferase, isoleucine patch superfamily [Thalassobaculum litoreum DSM 18839]